MHELGVVYPSDGTLQVMNVGSTAANVGYEAMKRKWMVRKEGSSVQLVGKGRGGGEVQAAFLRVGCLKTQPPQLRPPKRYVHWYVAMYHLAQTCG